MKRRSKIDMVRIYKDINKDSYTFVIQNDKDILEAFEGEVYPIEEKLILNKVSFNKTALLIRQEQLELLDFIIPKNYDEIDEIIKSFYKENTNYGYTIRTICRN